MPSYPDYPDNRLIVNNVDLSINYKMILVDGYTLEPPTPKTYIVDVPGGNGKIDLTEALSGDVAYDNRNQEFTFYLIDVADFEETKSDISNFLHGKSYDYTMTMDPGYTYHGRFYVSSYTHTAYDQGVIGVIKIKIDADPYKRKKEQVIRCDAIGGVIVRCVSGRMRVRPKIETSNSVRVIFNNKLVDLPQGTWNINDILFEQGVNEIYLSSYNIKNLMWKDLKNNNVTWRAFNTRKLFEWYKSNGDGTYVMKTWDDVATSTWSEMSNVSWNSLRYLSSDTGDIEDVYIAYEWGDL